MGGKTEMWGKLARIERLGSVWRLNLKNGISLASPVRRKTARERAETLLPLAVGISRCGGGGFKTVHVLPVCVLCVVASKMHAAGVFGGRGSAGFQITHCWNCGASGAS